MEDSGKLSQGVERARLESNGLMWTSWRSMTGGVIVGALGRVGSVRIAGLGGCLVGCLGGLGGKGRGGVMFFVPSLG